MPVVQGPEVWRAPEPSTFLAEWSPSRMDAVNQFLRTRFEDAWPSRFALACGYPLKTGGKRFRPLLSLAAADAVGAVLSPQLIATAASIELIHTYSLVHDDLPCMDDDSERRGSPTVHVVYDEAPALLVGDALLTEAFTVLTELPWNLSGGFPGIRTGDCFGSSWHGRRPGRRHRMAGEIRDLETPAYMAEKQVR